MQFEEVQTEVEELDVLNTESIENTVADGDEDGVQNEEPEEEDEIAEEEAGEEGSEEEGSDETEG